MIKNRVRVPERFFTAAEPEQLPKLISVEVQRENANRALHRIANCFGWSGAPKGLSAKLVHLARGEEAARAPYWVSITAKTLPAKNLLESIDRELSLRKIRRVSIPDSIGAIEKDVGLGFFEINYFGNAEADGEKFTARAARKGLVPVTKSFLTGGNIKEIPLN